VPCMSNTGATGPFAPLAGPAASMEEMLRRLEPPANGWLRAVREAQAVTQHSLAGKLGCKRQAWAQLEQSEARGAISLYSLRRAAEALGCELVYALVPKTAGMGPAAERPAAATQEPSGEGVAPAHGTGDAEELPTELR
jgi:transcriptional regulator with XRE-family HTH domain